MLNLSYRLGLLKEVIFVGEGYILRYIMVFIEFNYISWFYYVNGL